MTEIKQYSERDAMELDEVGGHYFRHVLAMTAEGLHSKSDIAAELGWRDMQISALQEQVRALAAESSAIKAAIPKLKDIEFNNENMDDVSLGEDVGFNDAVELMNRWSGETPNTDAAIREIRAQGAIDARNALVVADDGADIYAVLSNVAARIRAGEQP